MLTYRQKDFFEFWQEEHPDKKIDASASINSLSKPLVGAIFMCDFGEHSGSVQNGIRPCIVFDNFPNIEEITTSVVIPLTSSLKSTYLPTHVIIKANRLNGLKKDSMALREQIATMENNNLYHPLGIITFDDYKKICKADRIQSPFPDVDEETDLSEFEKYFAFIIPRIEKTKQTARCI